MYCPNCAAPIDGVKFCRACGANVSLVPQAMSGRLPSAEPDDSDRIVVGAVIGGDTRGRRRDKKAPSMAKGIQEAFMGLGFAFVSLALSFSSTGNGWWFWLLIPAFMFMGSGLAEVARAKQAPEAMPYAGPPPSIPSTPRAVEMPASTTSQLKPPPSIVEDTTRRFDPAERSGERR